MINKQTVIHDDDIKYYIIRKNIKNLNLRIHRNGEIVVSAPLELPFDKIESFITLKKNWIMKHLQKVESAQQPLIDENEIMLFGKRLKIKTIESNQNQITYDDCNLYVQYTKNRKPHLFIKEFLNRLCEDVFHDITKMTIRKMRYHATSLPLIKIRTMKSQWGNCHHKNQYITLNRSLIHYPFEFIEYVILHELVHFHVLNHSQEFYQIIELYMPDYKERIKLIK